MSPVVKASIKTLKYVRAVKQDLQRLHKKVEDGFMETKSDLGMLLGGAFTICLEVESVLISVQKANSQNRKAFSIGSVNLILLLSSTTISRDVSPERASGY